ncbi:type III PLP-dependent enzyme domain-containing protein [Mycobacterium tilburgii]|uniref:hypothetical protein n=1 Tax=Mycobacterium tilburgii TaxID=44467 RepID=UPI0021B305C1|nr:hypothetical protein [Mycobacterium tilburgii]
MPETPYLSLDLGRVRQNHRALRAALSGAQIRYAVEANPAEPVLRMLADEGCAFDVASVGEVDACAAADIDGRRLTFGNTIKKPIDIARAMRAAFADSPSIASGASLPLPSMRPALRWNDLSQRRFRPR